MHIWTIDKWEKYIDIDDARNRRGLRVRYEKNINPEVKRACKEFFTWIRSEYFFPKRVVVYMRASRHIKARDSDMVSATIWMPDDKMDEPYIRVSTGDYEEMLKKRGKYNALAAILASIAHELTHYFQWINNIELTRIGEERQATMYSRYILNEYAETREHP